jgi:regulator of protease activity HflC (stomatin/prohibitin superfamily)
MFKFVQTSTTGIMTHFGKFSGTVKPGLQFYVPFMHKIVEVSNRTQQINLKFDVLPLCQSNSELFLAVQYKIFEEDSEKAHFSLDNPRKQMSSYIESDVREGVSKRTLADLYKSFDQDIGSAVTQNLRAVMSTHGYTILNILLTDIKPNQSVKDAINNVSISEKNKIAATNNAQANYVTKIEDAKAERERSGLKGEGVALQRKNILEGYRKTILDMASDTGMTPADITKFILRLQELDTQKDISASPNTKVIFLNQNSTDSSKDNHSLISALETNKTN